MIRRLVFINFCPIFSLCPGDIIRVRQLPEAVRERGDEGELVREAVENVPAPSHGAAVRDVEGVAERGQSRLYRPVEPPLHGSGGANQLSSF